MSYDYYVKKGTAMSPTQRLKDFITRPDVFFIGVCLMLILLGAFCYWASSKPSMPPKPSMVLSAHFSLQDKETIGMGNIAVIHDDTRHVTCWIYSNLGTSISCISDSQNGYQQ